MPGVWGQVCRGLGVVRSAPWALRASWARGRVGTLPVLCANLRRDDTAGACRPHDVVHSLVQEVRVALIHTGFREDGSPRSR